MERSVPLVKIFLGSWLISHVEHPAVSSIANRIALEPIALLLVLDPQFVPVVALEALGHLVDSKVSPWKPCRHRNFVGMFQQRVDLVIGRLISWGCIFQWVLEREESLELLQSKSGVIAKNSVA